MAPVNSAAEPAITPATDLTTNIGIHSRKSVVAAHVRSERVCQEFERRGTQRVLEDVAKFASPEKVAAYILEQTEPHAPGDVVLLTGAGEVFPFFRMHTLLHCMLADFDEVPVVAAYPGSFNGSSFQLFNRLPADNYYRAIDIS